MWVESLCWEDALEEGMATHFQDSCLENPMDRAAWRATVQEVARVRQLSDSHPTQDTSGRKNKERRKMPIPVRRKEKETMTVFFRIQERKT